MRIPVVIEVGDAEIEALPSEQRDALRRRAGSRPLVIRPPAEWLGEVISAEFRLADATARIAEWARGVPGLAGVVARDYDVRGAVSDFLAHKVVERFPEALVIVEGTRAYRESSWAERSPRSAALAVHARVESYVLGIERPAEVEMEVSRVSRYTHPDGWNTTSVLVHVRSPVAAERIVIIQAE